MIENDIFSFEDLFNPHLHIQTKDIAAQDSFYQTVIEEVFRFLSEVKVKMNHKIKILSKYYCRNIHGGLGGRGPAPTVDLNSYFYGNKKATVLIFR